MKRRFKAKRRIRFRLVIVFFLVMLVIVISFNIVKNVDPILLMTQDYSFSTIHFSRNDILLKNGLNYTLKEYTEVPTFNEVTPPTEIQEKKKKIYVYNTHQSEEYADFSVLEAARALKEELSNYNIDTIVEETNITDEVKKNGYTYSQSYRVTKELMLSHKDDDISLYIDLHRDSSAKNVTTATIDQVNYAKLMFVVGGKHETYMDNYRVSDAINKMIKNNHAEISRGLLLRKSSSYNQEIDSNVVLIEVGGPHNTKDEVIQTIKILALAIKDYLEE